MAPAFLHVLERDVGRHAAAEAADRRGDHGLVAQVLAAQGETLQQPVDVDPGGHRVVVASGGTRLLRAAWPGLRPAARGRRPGPGRRRGPRPGGESPRR